jgi:hypothetical protein
MSLLGTTLQCLVVFCLTKVKVITELEKNYYKLNGVLDKREPVSSNVLCTKYLGKVLFQAHYIKSDSSIQHQVAKW